MTLLHPAQAALAFKLDAPRLAAQLEAFNARAEIHWFGLHGEFAEGGVARILMPASPPAGLRGGGGSRALNGAAVAAGFDAAVVLAGLGHYDTPVVVTVELSIRYLRLADGAGPLVVNAWTPRTSARFGFIEAKLVDTAGSGTLLATASAIVAPGAVPRRA